MPNPFLFAADPLKLPFGVAGAVLVLWAAFIAGIGLRRPQFPGGAGGQRVVMAVTVLLAAIVMGIAVEVG